jgi:hypothetical protein
LDVDAGLSYVVGMLNLLILVESIYGCPEKVSLNGQKSKRNKLQRNALESSF